MSDRAHSDLPARDAWRAMGHRAAVAAGALAALISLIHHVPVSVASLRGGLAWLAVLVVAKLGLVAFERACSLERRAASEEESRS